MLIKNSGNNTEPATEGIKYQRTIHCFASDENYGKCIAKSICLNLVRGKELDMQSNNCLIQALLKP